MGLRMLAEQHHLWDNYGAEEKRAAEALTPRRLYLPLVLADRRLW